MTEPQDPYTFITISFDRDTGEPVLNLGDCDPWSADALLTQARDAVRASLPEMTIAGELEADGEEAE